MSGQPEARLECADLARQLEKRVVDKDSEYLDKVRAELARYEHPLFDWDAAGSPRGVEVTVRLKDRGIYDEPYRFYLIAREIDAPAFQWDFQRQLYNYLHDFVVEMFMRSPHIRES
jgi:hypothetical protein